MPLNRALLSLFASLALAASSLAVTPDFVDNFASPGTSGWGGGTPLSNPLAGGANGPADGYLRLATSFPDNFGTKNSLPVYQGNWAAANIRQVRFSLNDLSPNQSFAFHFLLTTLAGGNTTWQYNPAFDPPLDQWQQVLVDLSSSANWTRIRGSATFQQTLQAVDIVHFRHDPPPYTAFVDFIAGQLGLDQIMLLTPQWYPPAGGSWSNSLNWAGPVPNTPDASANLLRRPTSPATLSLASPTTVGHITFDNPNPYTIAGTPALSLQTTAANASISLLAGNHAIAAPLLLNNNATITGPGSLTTANISNPSSLLLLTNLTADDLDGPGSTTVGDPSTPASLSARHIRQSSLTLAPASSVSIRPAGNDSALSILNSLSIPPTATLDLSNNDLLVHAHPDARLDTLAQLINHLRSNRLRSAAATPYTTLAIALNDKGDSTPLHATFNAQPVTINDILIKYTYKGDANLDGVVNADDYFQIDSAFIAQNASWYTGDFNYDNTINADDYFLIDSAFIAQTSPLAARMVTGAPLPESGTMTVLGIAGLGLGGSRHFGRSAKARRIGCCPGRLGGPGRLLGRGSRGPVRACINAYGSSGHGLAAGR